MINPDYLKTFITLIETGHFTRTAEKLHMTQPGVSQHIKKLEDHFNVSLILRTGKTFSITEAGRRLIEYSKALYLDYETFKVSIIKDSPFEGECKLSSPGSFGLRLFDVLLKLAKTHPLLKVSLSVNPNSSIPVLLLNRQIDLGFMTKDPNDPKLIAEKFSQEELLLITPKNFKFKKISDLKKLGFVNHPDGYFLAERLLAKNFPKEFISMDEFNSRVFINQISRILDPVVEGLGFTVLPEGVYKSYSQSSQLSTIRLKTKVTDDIYKVQRKNEYLPNRYSTIIKSLSTVK